MKNKNFLLSLVLLVVLMLVSCTKSSELNSDDLNDPNLANILKMGFSSSDVKINGTKYLIQGDMAVDKINSNLISDKIIKKNYSGSLIKSQQANESTVTISSISVFIDPSISSNNDWVDAINLAVSDWNGIRNFGLQFSINTSNPASDIRIQDGTVSAEEIVIADLPINGSPGSTITIDLNQPANAEYKRLKIAHALGHTIGFRHTDYHGENGANYIFGTVPSSQNNTNPDIISIMNSTPNLYVQSWIGFSPMDILAIRTVYPLDNSQTPIFRYYKNARHFYTSNWNELGYNTQGWQYEGYEGFVYNTSASSRVPIYRYYASSTGDFLYTTNWNELGSGRFGYINQGVLGYAFSTQVTGTVPLYRFLQVIRGVSLHFYTRNSQEGSGWTNEGICCYVLE